MSDKLSVSDIKRMIDAAKRYGLRNSVMYMSRDAYIELRKAHDPYGIYRQRELMKKSLPNVVVYRGDEWWHGK